MNIPSNAPQISSLLKALCFTCLLTACATANLLPGGPNATLNFQNGQTVTVKLSGTNPALEAAFTTWARTGLYTNAPVYRQLPGVFLLTGKPRLAGYGYVPGTTTNAEAPSAHYGQIGLVKHIDGTVGPEIILVYGQALTTCCEAPANVRIGTITEGRLSLHDVQRGDNLQTIAIQP